MPFKFWRDCGMTGAMRKNSRYSRSSPAREHAPRPLNLESLSELAIAYVGRFATTRAKLLRYLQRKLFERGWDGEDRADPEAVATSMVAMGYVDDAAYATMKARALGRKGYGARRVSQALFGAGVGESDRAEAAALADADRLSAALRLAERRRWGPFASVAEHDRSKRERMIAAFMRAGHNAALARRILSLAPGADLSDLEE